jgi:RimJ/RimL family protein N-acetyltransferase
VNTAGPRSEPGKSKCPAVVIETRRLYFRRFREEDAPLLFELDSDPEVMRFISKAPPESIEKIRRRITERILPVYQQSPPRGIWMAHLRENDGCIGWFHLRTDERWHDGMELGYRLKRSAWGRGLATEGSLALLAKAFGDWGYARVFAHTMAINHASRRVMEKSGLHFECEFLYPEDVPGGWVTVEERHAVKYSITREAWLRRQPARTS